MPLSTGDPGEHQGSDAAVADEFDESSRDDFEIAVSAIDERRDAGSAMAAEKTNDAPSAPALSRSPFARLTPRRRALAAGSAAVSVVLALVVILATFPGAGPTLRTVLGFALPAPTATLAPNADSVRFTNTVPWGSLSVDGKAVPLAARPFGGYSEPPPLAHGTHMLVYTADPFPTVHCRVSVPADSRDTCPLASSSGRAPSPSAAGSRLIDLQATPDHLPSDQYYALVHAIAAVLTVPDGTVPPGDHYLPSTAAPAMATVPMAARLLPILPARGTVIAKVNELVCDPLCAPPFGPVAIGNGSPVAAWRIAALVGFEWQFAASDSAVANVFPIIWVSVNRSHAWTVTLVEPEAPQITVCVIAGVLLQQALNTGSIGQQGYSATHKWGTTVTDGCLLQVTTGDLTLNGTASGRPSLTILYRFGTLIAADAATKRVLPQLPLASAHEQTIIARLSSGR